MAKTQYIRSYIHFSFALIVWLYAASHSNAQTYDFEPNILLTALEPKADMQKVSDKLKSLGASIADSKDLQFVRLLKIKTASGKMSQTAQELGKDKTFLAVQFNYQHVWYTKNEQQNSSVSDPSFPNQWYLFSMKVPQSWSVSRPTGQYIAFLDSGCSKVRELKGKLAGGLSAYKRWSYLNDDATGGGHGTKIATIAAARTNNQEMVAAVNPWAYVYPIKIGNLSGTDSEHIIVGLAQLIASGVKIAVIGAGPATAGWSLLDEPLVHGALVAYYQNGGLAFAPSGNSGVSLRSKPNPALILVSATDQSGKLASFSNYGNAIWFAAPGVNIATSDKDGQAISISGTSTSAAIVAGLASLVWCNNPRLTNVDVLNILKNSATGGGHHDANVGYGIINAQTAVGLVSTGNSKSKK